VFKIIVPDGVIYGCGDLIFSSHTIFTLVFVRTYQRYGTRRYCLLYCSTEVHNFFTRFLHLMFVKFPGGSSTWLGLWQ